MVCSWDLFGQPGLMLGFIMTMRFYSSVKPCIKPIVGCMCYIKYFVNGGLLLLSGVVFWGNIVKQKWPLL